MHLDGTRPFISVRAATTKKKTAQQPLIPALAEALRLLREQKQATVGKVFPRGMPMPKTFRADLATYGIPFLDDVGRRVDFHSLRHTFATMLSRAGVPPRVIMELMRHSDLRLSANTYTDATCLATFDEVGKLNTFLPSSLASPKSDKSSPEAGKLVQSDAAASHANSADLAGKTAAMTDFVQSCPNGKMAEREGFEGPPSNN